MLLKDAEGTANIEDLIKSSPIRSSLFIQAYLSENLGKFTVPPVVFFQMWLVAS